MNKLIFMSRQVDKIRNQGLPRGLRKGSFNQKVFFMIAHLIKEIAKETTRDVKDLYELFCEYDMSSLAQKFHGTYYANLEDSMPTGEEMKQATIKKAIKKLELSDYIKTKQDKHDKENFKIHLTTKGALEFIKFNIDDKRKKEKWNGKWRIIVFDILEDQRQIRNLLRNRLRWLGFKELQKSVWIFPYDASRELKEILDLCNVDIIGDVRFLTVEKMEEDSDLREDFGIK